MKLTSTITNDLKEITLHTSSYRVFPFNQPKHWNKLGQILTLHWRLDFLDLFSLDYNPFFYDQCFMTPLVKGHFFMVCARHTRYIWCFMWGEQQKDAPVWGIGLFSFRFATKMLSNLLIKSCALHNNQLNYWII